MEKTIVFKGSIRKEVEGDFVGLDDIISVNGVIGWLDFIGQDVINAVDENGEGCIIAIKDIRTVEKYSTFIEGNMTNISISELLNAA
jgi:hypothetical protein